MTTTRFLKTAVVLAALAAALAIPAMAIDADAGAESACLPMPDQWAEREEAPAFHPDWSPEERELLLHMRNTLKNDFMKELLQGIDDFCGLIGQVVGDIPRDKQAEYLYYAKIRFEWLGMLDQVISGGYAALPTAGCRFQCDEDTVLDAPQRVAAYLGEYEAMKMLILRGADPNALMRTLNQQGEDRLAAESPLASVIANVKKGGYAERMEVAEWLLAHGASFDVPHVEWRAHMCCGAWCDSEEGPHPELFEWGLDRGLPLTDGIVDGILDTEGTLPLLQRLLKEGRIDPKNPPEGRCMLTHMMRRVGYPDTVEKTKLLLAAGALVEGVEPPIREVQLHLEITTPEDLKDDDNRTRWEQGLQLLGLLVSHGAQAGEDADDLPDDPALAAQVLETIHRAMQSRVKK